MMSRTTAVTIATVGMIGFGDSVGIRISMVADVVGSSAIVILTVKSPPTSTTST